VPVLQVLPEQQGSPLPPQAVQVDVPPRPAVLQISVVLEQVEPVQHGCPSPPQATHDELPPSIDVWQMAPPLHVPVVE
jgi:hypothetical protein